MAVVSPAPAAQGVGVSGTHLTLNGSTWMPKGVMIRAFVSTQAWLSNPANGETSTALAAADYGSAAQVAALRAYGADTLRFPVSQYYLASGQNPPGSSTSYATNVVNATLTARSKRNVSIGPSSFEDGPMYW